MNSSMRRDIFSHNFLIKKLLREAISKRAKQYLRGRLLDIGCGMKQYHDVLAPLVDEHIGLDHVDTPHDLSKADIVGSAYEIPEDSESFDSVLCTEVLEHLEEPAKAIRECHRVLKPNGYAVYTNPFIWHLHEEPRDFFRYSKHGLRYLFENNGFDVVEISPLNGFWGTFGQLFVYNLHTYNRSIVRYTYIIPLVGFLIQHIAHLLDRLSPRPIWTSHYVSVVRRKA